MRSRAVLSRFLIALSLAFAASGGAMAQSRQGCAEGPAEASTDSRLRPVPTASCPYGAPEFNRRVLALLGVGNRGWSVEMVERTFGLPELYTIYDSPWEAYYSTYLSGAAGTGEWRVMVNFEEAYWPRDASQPARYRGAERPIRTTRARPEIRFTIGWLAPRDMVPGDGFCLETRLLLREARRRGWRVREEVEMIMDAGPRARVTASRGDAIIDLAPAREAPCLTDFELTIEP